MELIEDYLVRVLQYINTRSIDHVQLQFIHNACMEIMRVVTIKMKEKGPGERIQYKHKKFNGRRIGQ